MLSQMVAVGDQIDAQPSPEPRALPRRAPPPKKETVEVLSEAEAEAERVLMAELEADNEARQQLAAAVRARAPAALRAALGTMGERGLDCDDETIDAARLLLSELEAKQRRGR